MSGLHIQHKTDLHLVRWTSLFLVACAIVGIGFIGYKWYMTGELPPFMPIASADPSIDESEPSESGKNKCGNDARPCTISIKTLGIDSARIEKVGLDTNKLVDTPKNIHDAGWYEKSSMPNADSAVVGLVGVSHGMSKDGLFAKVSDLESGNTIEITTGNKKKYEYSVVSVKTMHLDEFNTQGMKDYMTAVEPENGSLNIVVYAGNWVPKLSTYDTRILVRATASE